MDILVLSFSIFLLDFGSLDRGSSTYSFLKRTIGNPPFLGLILGLIIINMPVQIPPAVPRMLDFISASAAPCALFALGVLLSARIQRTDLKSAVLITVLRIIIHPLVAFLIIIVFGNYHIDIARTSLMVAAAPVGLMALTFAPRYGVSTAPIALSILWTFLASLIVLPLIGTIQI